MFPTSVINLAAYASATTTEARGWLENEISLAPEATLITINKAAQVAIGDIELSLKTQQRDLHDIALLASYSSKDNAHHID
jgi:hypothetical protein